MPKLRQRVTDKLTAATTISAEKEKPPAGPSHILIMPPVTLSSNSPVFDSTNNTISSEEKDLFLLPKPNNENNFSSGNPAEDNRGGRFANIARNTSNKYSTTVQNTNRMMSPRKRTDQYIYSNALGRSMTTSAGEDLVAPGSPLSPSQQQNPGAKLSIHPNENDVLLGRGGAVNSHPGNMRFRSIVAIHRPDYAKAAKHDKLVIAKNIVDSVRTTSVPNARFLKKKYDGWYEVNEKHAVEKTSQALREKAPPEVVSQQRLDNNEANRALIMQHLGPEMSNEFLKASPSTSKPLSSLAAVPPKRRRKILPLSALTPPPKNKEDASNGNEHNAAVANVIATPTKKHVSTKQPQQRREPRIPSFASRQKSVNENNTKLASPSSFGITADKDRVIDSPASIDILFGEDNRLIKKDNPKGYQTVQDAIDQYKLQFIGGDEEDRMLICTRIFQVIHYRSCGTRYLKLYPSTKKWHQISDRRAVEAIYNEILFMIKNKKTYGEVLRNSDECNNEVADADNKKKSTVDNTRKRRSSAKAATKESEDLMLEPGTTPYAVPSRYDVLLGRGGLGNNHPGNQRFRDLVSLHRPDYVTAAKFEKQQMARNIVRAIRNGNPAGKFLKTNPKDNMWYDVGDKNASEKTSQALREKPDERLKEKIEKKIESFPTSSATEEQIRKLVSINNGFDEGKSENERNSQGSTTKSTALHETTVINGDHLQSSNGKQESRSDGQKPAQPPTLKQDKGELQLPKSPFFANGPEGFLATLASQKYTVIPVSTPRAMDVLVDDCGVASAEYHPGNRGFREVIAYHHSEFKKSDLEGKIRVAMRIVQYITKGTLAGGHFLRKMEDGKYHDVGESVACQMTYAALNLLNEGSELIQNQNKEQTSPAPKNVNADKYLPPKHQSKPTVNLPIQQENQYKELEPGKVPIISPGINDVLMGRGGIGNNHEGNLRFRELVTLHRPTYAKCQKYEKQQVAKAIVQAIREGDPPGRFLKMNPEKNNVWFDVGDRIATEKTSQSLREKPWEPENVQTTSVSSPEVRPTPLEKKRRGVEESIEGGSPGNNKKRREETAGTFGYGKVESTHVGIRDANTQHQMLSHCPPILPSPASAAVLTLQPVPAPQNILFSQQQLPSIQPKSLVPAVPLHNNLFAMKGGGLLNNNVATNNIAPSASSSSQQQSGNKKPNKPEEVTHPNINDVLLGRGGGTNNHEGNVRWRRAVTEKKQMYLETPKGQKKIIAKFIVQHVRNQIPSGRFLQKNPKTGKWQDIGDRGAEEKTSQALREGAPAMRHAQQAASSKHMMHQSHQAQAHQKYANRQRMVADVDSYRRAQMGSGPSMLHVFPPSGVVNTAARGGGAAVVYPVTTSARPGPGGGGGGGIVPPGTKPIFVRPYPHPGSLFKTKKNDNKKPSTK